MIYSLLSHLVRGLELFSSLVWGCVPPLAVVLLYYRRVRSAPPLAGVMLFFGVGIFSGLLAWGIERSFMLGLQQLNHWNNTWGNEWSKIWSDPHLIPHVLTADPHVSFEGLILLQLGVIAPLREACKLVGVVLPLIVMIRRYQRVPTQPSLIMLGTIAVAMGMTAQDSSLAIWRDSSVIMQRTIGAPIQALFSAPWGLALGLGLCRGYFQSSHLNYPNQLTMRAWLTACLVHAGSNCWVNLALTPSMNWLVYPLFAWWLWLWWLTEGLLKRAQGEPSLRLITATTRIGLIQEYAIALTALGIGGTTLVFLQDFGSSFLFLWDIRETIDQSTLQFLGIELLRIGIFAAIALYLFRYLYDRGLQNR